MKNLLILFSLFCAVSAQAALISFDANIAAITNTAAVAQVTADTVDPIFQNDVVLSRGAGLLTQTFIARFGSSDFTLDGEAASLENDDYLTFTLSPANGGNFDFAGYSLSLVTQSAPRGPLYLGVYSSKAGFSEGKAIQTLTLEQTGKAGTAVTVDLSSLGTIAEPLEIRFYGYNALIDTGALSINQLSIVQAAVPEPMTTSLLPGTLIVGVLSRVRRKPLRAKTAE